MKEKFGLILLFLGFACVFAYGQTRESAEPGSVQESPVSPVWLELPGAERNGAEYRVTHYAQMEGRKQRNYTVLYDPDTFASYWVAYPLCHSHMTSGREEIWDYDPKVRRHHQTSGSRGCGRSS